MQQISGRDAALAVLADPSFVVPSVPSATTGVGWLRATVGRFSTGEVHERRRALSDSLRAGGGARPVATLARAMGVLEPLADLVRDGAQAYQPGTFVEGALR